MTTIRLLIMLMALINNVGDVVLTAIIPDNRRFLLQ